HPPSPPGDLPFPIRVGRAPSSSSQAPGRWSPSTDRRRPARQRGRSPPPGSARGSTRETRNRHHAAAAPKAARQPPCHPPLVQYARPNLLDRLTLPASHVKVYVVHISVRHTHCRSGGN